MAVAAELGRLLVDVRAGRVPSEMSPPSERRSLDRRDYDTAGGLLAAVVEDVDRRYREVSRQLREMKKALRGLEGEKRTALASRLEKVQATEKALARDIETLKALARSPDVKVTVPSRRRSRKS
jgi:hypothetical protein